MGEASTVWPARAGSDRLGWQSFLERPMSSDVGPVSATVLSDSVSNARGVTSAGARRHDPDRTRSLRTIPPARPSPARSPMDGTPC